MGGFRSFGGYPGTPQRVATLPRSLDLPEAGQGGWLAVGCGSSYGDVCLNGGGQVLRTTRLDRFIAFDRERGILRAEAGVTLADVLDLVVPRGWMLPVVPGTRQVTLGGAVANDVHGKNHHVRGSFGCHVRELVLLRSDGARIACGPAHGTEWFQATVGGLGLTGLVSEVELQLMPLAGPLIEGEEFRFERLDALWDAMREAESRYEYVVAWIDCLARGARLGRGILSSGRHAAGAAPPARASGIGIPFTPPFSLVQAALVRAYNGWRWHRAAPGTREVRSGLDPFLFPLDGIANWNRMYGRRGFLQHQCVVPDAGQARRIVEHVAQARAGSMLAVVKAMGADHASLGMLSFPRPGVTVAIDFPFHGARTLALLDALDRVVLDAGGALYPAKDARMSAAMFRHSFPAWRAFERYRDPAIQSEFWQRVTTD